MYEGDMPEKGGVNVLYRLIINNILYSFCIPPTAAQRVAMLLDQMSWLTLTKWSAVE